MREFFIEISTIELLGVEDGGECVDGCYDYYRSLVSLPDDGWYDCTVMFDELSHAGWGIHAPFNRGAVTGVQFNFELWNLPYDLAVDDFQFVANPNLETSCIPIRS